MSEASVNRVELSGYVANVFLRKTESGKDVANFSLKLTHFDRQGKEHAQFLNCTAWMGQAERIAALPRGSRVRLLGRLSTSSWIDKISQQKRFRLEVVCDELDSVAHLQQPVNHEDRSKRPIDDNDIPF